MVLNKLFKKKDDYGIIAYLDEIKKLNKFINEKQSNNIELNISDVKKIIMDCRGIIKTGETLKKKINSDTLIKDKIKNFMTGILNEKLELMNKLKTKLDIYEKQLKEHEKIIKKNETKE